MSAQFPAPDRPSTCPAASLSGGRRPGSYLVRDGTFPHGTAGRLGSFREAPSGSPASPRSWSDPAQAVSSDGAERARVLLPYSGSGIADEALEVAASLSHALSAEAWVLYVRAWDANRGGGRFYLETRSEAMATAQRAADRLRRLGVASTPVVRDASRWKVPAVIVAEAEALGVSAIVLATHARRALSVALLGSTSLAVARSTTRRVILVKPPRGVRRQGRPRWGPVGDL